MLNVADGLETVITAREESILDVTFLTTEARFYLSGYVKSQKSRMCSEADPYEIKDTPLR
jgi:hypothetical protein